MDITLTIKKAKHGYYYDTEDGRKYLKPDQVKKLKNKIKKNNKNKVPTMSNNQAVYIFQSNPRPTRRTTKRLLNKGSSTISTADQTRIDKAEQYLRNKDLNLSLNKPSTRYQITGAQFDPLKHENKLKIEGLENKIKLLEMNPRMDNKDKRELDYYRSIIRNLQTKSIRTHPTVEEVEEAEEEIHKLEEPKKGWLEWITGGKKEKESVKTAELEDLPSEEFEEYDEPISEEKAGPSHEILKVDGKIKCPICGRSYKSQGFRGHFDIKHKNDEDYEQWIKAYKVLTKKK